MTTKAQVEEVEETEPQEANDIMSLVGLEEQPEKESKGSTMGGSLPVQLYEKDGFNTKTDVEGLKGTVESIKKAFEDTLFHPISAGVRVRWKQYAYVFKALAQIELATQELEGESMVQYGLRRIAEAKK